MLGSGFAGLETAFLLRSLLDDDQAQLTVVSDRDDFLFKPNTIYPPIGGAERPLHIPLAKPLAHKHIKHRIATVEGIDVDRGTVHTSRGLPVHYDRLVIAISAGMRPEEILGLAEHAHQIWTGDPAAPVAVDQSAVDIYRVGISPLWRLGKKILGLYPPMRFRNGLPFHAGIPWRVLELGLRAGARWLAR